MDWAALGRHGEAAALNAQLAGALRAAARLADALESPRRGAALRRAGRRASPPRSTRATGTRAAASTSTCVDPGDRPRRTRASRSTPTPPRSSGTSRRAQRWASIVARITDPARLTFTAAPPIAPHGETLDPESGVVLANTFYSHFVYRALCKAGRFDLVARA